MRIHYPNLKKKPILRNISQYKQTTLWKNTSIIKDKERSKNPFRLNVTRDRGHVSAINDIFGCWTEDRVLQETLLGQSEKLAYELYI